MKTQILKFNILFFFCLILTKMSLLFSYKNNILFENYM